MAYRSEIERALNEMISEETGMKFQVFIGKREGSLIYDACIEVTHFESRARVRGSELKGGIETLSTILVDCDYNGEIFDMDLVFFAHELMGHAGRAWFPVEKIGEKVMVVFMDIYGNEAMEVVSRENFESKARSGAKARVGK